MARFFLIAGGCFAALAVILGAFGAHALRDRLTPRLFSTFETGVEYQMYHALALLAVGVLCHLQPDNRLLHWSGGGFVLGILLFSGSLYLLVFTGLKWLGPITPLGGLAFILGWILLTLAVAKSF